MIIINEEFLTKAREVLDIYAPTILILIEAALIFKQTGLKARAQLATEQLHTIQKEAMHQMEILKKDFHIEASMDEIAKAIGPRPMRLNFAADEPGFTGDLNQKKENPFAGMDEDIN